MITHGQRIAQLEGRIKELEAQLSAEPAPSPTEQISIRHFLSRAKRDLELAEEAARTAKFEARIKAAQDAGLASGGI